MLTSQKHMYKVGDFVYLEHNNSSPYLIRRIEEINRTDNGAINLKVQCFTRRRDIPTSLIQLADKNVRELEEDLFEKQFDELTELQKYRFHHHELFMNRPSGLDTLPVTQIRGKCDVSLLTSTDKLDEDFIQGEDNYFYALTYDQTQRTIVTDRGDIRVGPAYQAEIIEKMADEMVKLKQDNRSLDELETLMFEGEQMLKSDSSVSEMDLDRFITLTKSVGVFARALDATAATVQPLLQISAGMAARDCTMQWAMDNLHYSGYDLAEAVRLLVTDKGPILVRDQLEAWSPSEAQLFEDGIDRYGKDFRLIREKLLPWKVPSAIIEFYYMWKASDRYLAYKRTKAVDSEKRLKQVLIPPHTKPCSNQLTNSQLEGVTRLCEGCCSAQSEKWYDFTQCGHSHTNCRLCEECWSYWKKYGGLPTPQAQRVELMQQQQRKIPGQNDEKKSALRVSTQMTSVEQQKKRDAKDLEKIKKKEEKRSHSTEGDVPSSPVSASTSPKKRSDSEVRSPFTFVKTESVKQLRVEYDDIDSKKLARTPMDKESVDTEKVGKIVNTTEEDITEEKPVESTTELQEEIKPEGESLKRTKEDEEIEKPVEAMDDDDDTQPDNKKQKLDQAMEST